MHTEFRCERDTVKVALPLPQESAMWQQFALCVQGVRGGGEPAEFWPRVATLTQAVVCAVKESLENDCKPVKLE